MSSITGGKMANLQIRLSDDLKAQAHAVTADLGMDVATAVRLFLVQMIRDKALPFTPRTTLSEAQSAIQQTMSREEWLYNAVHTGLEAMDRNDYAAEKKIKDIFSKAGVHVS